MSSGPVAAIPVYRYQERLEAARDAVARDGAGGLLLGVGADLRWLAGYAPHPLERLTCLVVPAHGRPVLVVPRLEEPAARLAPVVQAGLVDLAPWNEVEDPFALAASRLPASGGDREPRALVSESLRASFLLRFQDALPGVRFGIASPVLAPLRMVKQAEEVELLRTAARAADRAVLGIIRGRLIGRTEADVAREVRQRLEDEGHEAPSFWIVGSGPNSASPHHEPGERVIGAGEPIVFDIGGTIGGYGSDITRTVWVAGGDGASVPPDDTFRNLYGVLQDAQRIATEAVGPGVPCEAIDSAAREHIDRHGYGERFIHRTGHGIGLEGHEEPYLVAGNELPLAVGHAFSVEPGIYLEGRYGARIEDIIVCAEDGPDVLNEAPRELLVVTGS